MTFNLPETASSPVICQPSRLSTHVSSLHGFSFTLLRHDAKHPTIPASSMPSPLHLTFSGAFMAPGRRAWTGRRLGTQKSSSAPGWVTRSPAGCIPHGPGGKAAGESLGNSAWVLGHGTKTSRERRQFCSQLLKELPRETREVSLRENTDVSKATGLPLGAKKR